MLVDSRSSTLMQRVPGDHAAPGGCSMTCSRGSTPSHLTMPSSFGISSFEGPNITAADAKHITKAATADSINSDVVIEKTAPMVRLP